jgi:hypothetical protein
VFTDAIWMVGTFFDVLGTCAHSNGEILELIPAWVIPAGSSICFRLTIFNRLALEIPRHFVGDSSRGFARLTGLSLSVQLRLMELRLRMIRKGDRVTVRDCEKMFHLPEGLPEFTECIYVGHDHGSYILHALGREWSVSSHCVEHVEEVLVSGVWLEWNDRRARKAKLHEEGLRPMPRRGLPNCSSRRPR